MMVCQFTFSEVLFLGADLRHALSKGLNSGITRWSLDTALMLTQPAALNFDKN